MKKKPALPLCARCRRAKHDPLFRFPAHLVHPEHGAHMVFDVRGEAICPECGARWRRLRNEVELVSDWK
jgi:hypothetical protein